MRTFQILLRTAFVFILLPGCFAVNESPLADVGPVFAAIAGSQSNTTLLFTEHVNPSDASSRRILVRNGTGDFQAQDYSGGPSNIRWATYANGTLFALDNTTNGRVWYSEDKGQTWSFLDHPNSASAVFTRMVACGDYLYATQNGIATITAQPDSGMSVDLQTKAVTTFAGRGASTSGTVHGLNCVDNTLVLTSDQDNNIWKATPVASIGFGDWQNAPSDAISSAPSFIYQTIANSNQIMAMIQSTCVGVYSGSYDSPVLTSAVPGMGISCENYNTVYNRGMSELNGTFFIGTRNSSGDNSCRIRTSTDGSNWTTTDITECSATSTDSVVRTINGLGSEVYVSTAYSTNTQSRVFYSADAGVTYNQVDISGVLSDSTTTTDVLVIPPGQ